MYKKQRRDLYILPKGIDLSNKKSPAKRQYKQFSAVNRCRASTIRLKQNSNIRIKKPEQIKAHGSPSPVILGAEEPYHFYLLRLVSFCKESCPIGKLDVSERPATLFAPFSWSLVFVPTIMPSLVVRISLFFFVLIRYLPLPHFAFLSVLLDTILAILIVSNHMMRSSKFGLSILLLFFLFSS